MSATFAVKNSFVARSYNRSVIAIGLIVTLFLLTATIPLAQAKSVQIPKVEFYQERRGVCRFVEYIELSPETGLPPGSFYKVNVYVFDTKDGLVLVDCGAEALYVPLMEEIGKKFNKKPIAAVLLTHGHADHAGAGHYFVEAGIPVYAPVGDAGIIWMGMHIPGVPIPTDFTYTGYMPTELLFGGETLFGLKVIPTPGHSAGSVCFVDEKTEALFSGDTTISYSNDEGPEDMTFELEFMTLQMSDDNSLWMQIDSLNDLMGLANSGQADTILPSHNTAYHGKDVQPYIQNSIDVVTQALMMR